MADGFGARGEPLSTAAIGAPAALDAPVPAGELLNALSDAVRRAAGAVGDHLSADPVDECSGTALTALVLSGSRLGLVHVGDARAYPLRGGELFRITHDHTAVRSLIAEGGLTGEEALTHPQRSMLVRALTGGEVEPADGAGGPDNVVCVVADVVVG
ncbi:PP2C family protein-serine/threonine phosphatase [Saccharothrix sp. Mg75]|uniref:PP2C family protein-serine/threonine phosphatase n=1 Tax=Saccharothrix sp. Mg75 TaxID=3445357 RepID=UPI003EE8873E